MATPTQIKKHRKGLRWSAVAAAMAVGVVTAIAGAAFASEVDVAVVDVTVPTNSVTLAPGASGNITINMSVTGSQAGTATFEVYRDWALSGGTFVGSNPQEFTVGPRGGGDPATTFSTSGTVSVAAGQSSGMFTLAVGAFDITNSNATGGKLAAGDPSNYQVTVSAPSDTTPPTVTSINRVGTSPTNTAGNVSWTVQFSEDVGGVDAADFALANTGLSGSPAIQTATAVDGDTYTVAASSGTGSGSLGLNLNDNDSIADGAGNKLGGTGTGTAGGGGTGNGSFVGQVYTIDRAAPTVTAAAVKGTAPGFADAAAYTADTWTNKSVRVTFTCADSGGSGLTLGSGNEQQDFTAETSSAGATATFSGTCADNAGNSAAGAGFSPIKIDLTDPDITASATKADSTAYTSGSWTNQTVTVSFLCSDPLSGIPTGTCPANVVVSSNTSATGQNVSGSVSDNAGNAKTSNTINVKVDKTNPTVSVTGFTNGQQLIKGATLPTPGCDSDDLLSGVASTSGPTLKAGTGLVNGVGSATYVCSATDNAGNTETAESTYTVIYDWDGFFSPVENPNAWNSAKAGQSIPVKFSLGGDQGLSIFAAAFPKVIQAQCPSSSTVPDPIEEYATSTANSGLVYDALAGQYVYVWKTDAKTMASKCFRLDVKLNDGTTHSANFKFTK